MEGHLSPGALVPCHTHLVVWRLTVLNYPLGYRNHVRSSTIHRVCLSFSLFRVVWLDITWFLDNRSRGAHCSFLFKRYFLLFSMNWAATLTGHVVHAGRFGLAFFVPCCRCGERKAGYACVGSRAPQSLSLRYL